MKIILEYDNEKDALLAIHGVDWALVVLDMKEQLRCWLKHGEDFKGVPEALEAVRERLAQFQEDRGVHEDMIP